MFLTPKQTLVVGNPQELKLQAIEKGSGEALIIVSRKPLKNTVKTMRALAAEQKRAAGVVELKGSSTSPDEVFGDLLKDLRDARGRIVATPVSNSDTDMATLSIAFEVG